jgi:predicted permease
MSLLSRIANVFRRDRLDTEIEEEFRAHIQESVDRGRDPADARRAFGPLLQQREASREIRLIPWLESLRADAVFGWRQLRKHKAATAAAVLSLGLAIGACTSAFRLIDALLLRPLPVKDAAGLYAIGRSGIGPGGNFRVSDGCEYPLFRQMRAAVRNQAELIAVSFADRVDLTYASDEEMERAYRQYVSGWMFDSFGLRPAAGRLLTADDDAKPGASPYAVLSQDYWTRRFARDPQVVGRHFHLGNDVYQIVGVVEAPFTGTEPGIMTDIFIPTMMHPGVSRSDQSWFRALAHLKPDVAAEPVRARLHAIMSAFDHERAKAWTSQSKQFLDRFLNQTLVLEPAAAGVSGMQTSYRRALLTLGALVALVLLIACANVANLMAAQAAARAREMAMRVSLGAGRRRLIQLVLIESAWLGFLAAAIGGAFAWWAAPFVAGRIRPPGDPARLFLPADWRVLAFGLALTMLVTALFGLAPALRAAGVQPAGALKGGERPHSRRRLMHALIAVQVAFCFLVHFAAGLFVATFSRLANQSTGFSAERLLDLETASLQPQPLEIWEQTAAHLRTMPGVEAVALSGWPLLGGNGWNGFIWINGAPTEVLAYFLGVTPGWADTMKIPFSRGRDLLPSDPPNATAIVNHAFIQQCFHGENPVGKWFEKETGDGRTRARYQVVGVVSNARYRDMREPITPTAYVLLPPSKMATFVVRTATSNPLALAAALRREVPRSRPEFRVSNTRTQIEINQQHTVRERLLATLAVFFAGVALLLAGIGLYGVLDYSVLQRRREIGIRMAVGAQSSDIARRVAWDALCMVAAGAIVGLWLGVGSVRYIEALLYGVKATEPGMLLMPPAAILTAAFLAALPAIVRAVRIDPVAMLRSE